MPSDHYCHQTTNNLEKLFEQKDAKNILKVATSIFLTIGMHIRPTRLLEVGLLTAEYDSKGRLRERCTSANWGDDNEIEEVVVADDDKDDNEEDLR